MRIAIIADPGPCGRTQFWTRALGDVEVVDLAKWVDHENTERFILEELETFDVLVVSWDAVNGDPDFGADRAQAWVAFRREHFLNRVKDGLMLIIEGQANLAVPAQPAYDALLGAGEVRVSGPEDPLDPQRQVDRIGTVCHVTEESRKHDSPFGGVPSELDSTRLQRPYSEMFPDGAGRRVPPWLEHHPWNAMYRGWFRWNRLRETRFDWRPIVRRAAWPRQPTMLAAPYGVKGGGIFVTTMLLASTGEQPNTGSHQLIRAMLACVGHMDGYFPYRARTRELVGLRMQQLVLIGLGTGVTLFVNFPAAWHDAVKWLVAVAAATFGGFAARPLRRLRLRLRSARGS